jgi:hypothetical protein
VSQLEQVLVGLFGASWLFGLALSLDFLRLPTGLEVGYYGVFGAAASLGWLAGLLYVRRSTRRQTNLRRAALFLYLLGTPGLVYLLWALAPRQSRLAAPLIPVYAFVVFGIFFLVPALLVRPPRARD